MRIVLPFTESVHEHSFTEVCIPYIHLYAGQDKHQYNLLLIKLE